MSQRTRSIEEETLSKIKMTRLKNENKVYTGFDNERDKYIDDSYSEKTGKKLRQIGDINNE